MLESHQEDLSSCLPHALCTSRNSPPYSCSKRQGLITAEKLKALCLDPTCWEGLGCLPREQEALTWLPQLLLTHDLGKLHIKDQKGLPEL